MHKKIIYRLLVLLLFLFISVTFLIHSDLNAETQKFWVDKSHWEMKKEWVDTSHMVYQGYWKDKDVWVDTSYTVSQGYWETKKEWVDTSHMVYQGYWKDVSKSFWVDTSQWVSSGYWKDVTERVWITSGYTAYRDIKKWVDTSHNVWVSSGYWGSKWVDTSHWEIRSYNVWVSSGYWAGYWVDTSHWETRSYNVWVSSGYWGSYWVNTSHWETRRYYNRGWKSYNVWVNSGYWASKWVNTSHWETRSYNIWVSSGYWGSKWVDTSHWETRSYNVWVSSGHWASYWVDTSHWTWVNSGYWKTGKEAYWVDTSHWEDQKVWVSEGHWETRYRNVENWDPCDKTFADQLMASEPKNVILSKWDKSDKKLYEGTINGTMYRFKKHYYLVLPGNNLFSVETIAHPWVIFKIKYICSEVLNWKKEAYSVWVPGGHYKKEWVDTSHWEKSGYWQSYTYRTWVDTSYLKSEGHWETKKEWVDTSYTVYQGYWETKKEWVDTSHWETSGYWKDKNVWVEDGFYVSSLHGEVIVEKSPKYIFTRWHKDQNNEECSMKLNVSWKVDNSELLEGEEEKKIIRIYIYQDICRFNNNGVEKVTIFNGNVTPSVEGSINTITKFDYSGSEESILHIYLYAQNGESAHVYFNNPINGFRSINLSSEGSSSDANTWLGGNNYVKFEF